MPEPKISVIIACHNHRSALWECLQSIAAQDAEWPTEVIVVDDASSDAPEDVCRSFGARYFQISAHNPAAARNRGLRAARGEYVLFFDADNEMHPDCVRRHVEPLMRKDAEVVYSRRTYIGIADEAEGFRSTHSQYPVSYESLKMAPQIDTACAMRRSDLLPDPWDATLARFEDWDFHLTNMSRGLRYHFISDELWSYRVTPFDPADHRRNAAVNQQAFEQVREKHQLATAGAATVTVALPTMGREFAVADWLHRILLLEYPKEQLSLLFVDTSPDASLLTTHLQPFIAAHETEYAGIAVTLLFQPEVTTPEEVGMQTAQIMQTIGRHCTTPYLMVWENGLLCPPDTLTQLLADLQGDAEAVLAQGISRLLDVKYGVTAWQIERTGALTNLMWQQPTSGVAAIGAGSLSGVVARSVWWRTFAFPPWASVEELDVVGCDLATGLQLRGTTQIWLVDWAVRYERLLHTARGHTARLTMDRFDDAEYLFERRQLPDQCYSQSYEVRRAIQTAVTRSAVIILYDVSTVAEVERYILAAGLASVQWSIVLIPRDEGAWMALSQSSFPPGTVLKKSPERLAATVNQYLKESNEVDYVVVSRADILPPSQLYQRCRAGLGPSHPLLVGRLQDELFWDSRRFSTYNTGQAGVVPQLDLLLLYRPGLVWPWLEPRLAAVPALLGLSFGWQLLRLRVEVEYLAGYTSWHSQTSLRLALEQSDRRSFFTHLGFLFGMEVPMTRLLTFWWGNVHQFGRATGRESLIWFAGVLSDTSQRFTSSVRRLNR